MVVLALVVALVGCGSRARLEDAAGDLAPADAGPQAGAAAGSGEDANGSAAGATTTAPPAGSPGGGAGGAGGSGDGQVAAGAPGGGVPTTAAGTTRTTEAKPPLDIEITFVNDCVVAGTAQTMNINLGEPGALLYWVLYNQNRFGPSEAHHAPAGTWQVQWTVPPDTPPGKADAHVSAASYTGRRGEAVAPFTVAGLGSTC